jgi:hypothetical protein
MHLIRIRGGKVTEIRLFNDTHALVQAYFGGDIHSATVVQSEASEPLRR